MQATKQQQIVVYFIEEAKEHLDTIEQGLLSLQATMADTEQLNELFRAAHSVKGGAAMLGFSSIQKVGHHLEDGFKLIKDHPIEVDRRLEDLFLQVFDVLKGLIEALQSPFGLQEENAEKAVRAAEPKFLELDGYLNRLIRGGVTTVIQPIPAALPTKPSPEQVAVMHAGLKKLLQVFKQGDTPVGRQQLAAVCVRMQQLNSSREWQEMVGTAKAAIAHSQNAYSVLAPLIIKELKQATDLLTTGRGSEITPSRRLQQLVPVQTAARATPPVSAAESAPMVNGRQTGGRDPLVARPQQIVISTDPRAAARTLLESFDKAQLIELAEFLMKALQ